MTESFLEEPQQTIIPVSAREISLKSKSRSLESHSIASNENEELLEGGFHPMGLEAGEENMSPSKRVEKYLEPRIENVKKENTLADEVVHLKNGSVHINAKLKPVATAQHSPTERQKVERVQERLQVVEVHIGRIEVRAMPATTQTKRPSQPAGIMTLDEYLRSRSREK